MTHLEKLQALHAKVQAVLDSKSEIDALGMSDHGLLTAARSVSNDLERQAGAMTMREMAKRVTE